MRKRYSAALWISRTLSTVLWVSRILSGIFTPYSTISSAYQKPRFKPHILRHLLNALSIHDVLFKPLIKVPQRGVLLNVYLNYNRLLLVTGHYPLNGAIHCIMHDLALPFSVVAGNPPTNRFEWLAPPYPVWGTGRKCRMLYVSPSVLVRAKRALVNQHVVIVAIDTGRNSINENIFHFSSITKTPIMFFKSILNPSGEEIEISIAAPSVLIPKNSEEAARCSQEFREFLA